MNRSADAEYARVQEQLARGWNTWNTRSLLCWVHLPDAFAINLGIKSYVNGQHLREVLVGREPVRVGPHAYDGSYSELSVSVGKTTLHLQTATAGDDLVVLATPECTALRPSLLTAEVGFLWNRPGRVSRSADSLSGTSPSRGFSVFATADSVEDPNVVAMTPYFAIPLSGVVGLSTGIPRTVPEIEAIFRLRRAEHEARRNAFGADAELYDAIQTCTAWDTIYEPIGKRVITTVSRVWNSGSRGGFVLFGWDTFFAAMLASIDNRDLAYANAVEILRERTPQGFVPNNSQATGRKSLDRSQPPVGGITVQALYQKFGDRWFLEQTFDALLAWNRWWDGHRCLDGYLCWGSHPFQPVVGDPKEDQQNILQGAMYESGLDNSPMYDDVPFDPDRHLMLLADVGLMGLYAADCRALAQIAGVLHREPEQTELLARQAAVIAKLQELWDPSTGLFLNRRMDTRAFSSRLSPTHFYALLGGAATPEQADRMVREHLLNPAEFWGDWVLPSTPRNDPAYVDNVYWRGRIWAPMNWLVYLGLRNYDQPAARRALADRSGALLLREWREHRHIHENYNADTGQGCDSRRSDAFYHWGGLLGLIPLVENGHG
jgi:hypothetical protein